MSKCENCGREDESYNPYDYHPCPYKSEIDNDYDECNCCERCMSDCSEEI